MYDVIALKDCCCCRTAGIALKQLLQLQGNLETEVHCVGRHRVRVLHCCPVCQRSFTLNYLKTHIRAHTGTDRASRRRSDVTHTVRFLLTKHTHYTWMRMYDDAEGITFHD